MERLKFSVVIPTRERADTLYHTIRTCISQDYDNLEIIVSDNASNDNTRDVALSFKDKRIRYINTGKRLGMSSNWEFGLSHVTGDFVTFLGDDDGLLPTAVRDIGDTLSQHPYPALIWKKVDYNWPKSISKPNCLYIPLSNKSFVIHGRVLLYLLAKGLTSYGRLPVIYSGFVNTESITKVKNRTGNFFRSVTPDVYSGIALLSQIDKYIYSFRPFSVNGGSHHSSGQTSGYSLEDKTGKLFFQEMDIPQNTKMNVIPGALTACVTEALLQANVFCFNDSLKINLKHSIKRIFQEISDKNEDLYNNAVSILQSLNLDNVHKRYILKCKKRFSNHPKSNNNSKSNHFFEEERVLYVDSEEFGIADIYSACQFVGKILGNYQPPKHISAFSYANYFYTLYSRYINRFLFRRTF